MSEPFVSECCEGERCCFEGCSAQAEHKVEETIFHDDPLQIRHELTAYICHEHFRQIMGPAADRAPGRTPRDFRIPAQQERWQPIADFVCGHDNPNVLVVDDGVVSEAYYDGESDKWFKAGKSEHDFDFVRSDVLYPSHWMPMPKPPALPSTMHPDQQRIADELNKRQALTSTERKG